MRVEGESAAGVLSAVVARPRRMRSKRQSAFCKRKNSRAKCNCEAGEASEKDAILFPHEIAFADAEPATSKVGTPEDDTASSDLLLVADGELPSPPVSNVVSSKLEGLKQRTGMEIPGLLVGETESESLDLLCTEAHNFLGDYEFPGGVVSSGTLEMPRRSSTALSLLRSQGSLRPGWQTRRRHGFSLNAASRPDYENEIFGTAQMKLNRRGDRLGKRRRRQFDDVEDDWELQPEGDYNFLGDRVELQNREDDGQPPLPNTEFVQRVEKAVLSIRDAASKTIEETRSETDALEPEWSKSGVVSDTVAFVEKGLVERDTEARLVVLGMLAQEHVLFIGPPGTSKSEIGRRLSRLCGGPFFQRLLTRFTTPEEIFGPLSLRALENDEYVRRIDGFLPTATVAFLDEIFKANSAILNTLLTVLNERKFDNGAGARVSCPLKCVIGASNELPESEELDALLDRFLLKSYVTSVSDDGLVEILSAKSPASDPGIDPGISDMLDEVVGELSSSLGEISLGQDICNLIRDLRTFLRDDLGVYVSDRRLVKASRLLKVSAASHGRKNVDWVDCLLLQHMLWQVPEQRDTIREWLWDNMTPGNSDNLVEQTKFLLEGLASESMEMVRKTMGDVTGEAGARTSDLTAISSIREQIGEMEKLFQRQSAELERHMQLLDGLPHHLWIGHDEALAAKQHLSPLAKGVSAAVGEALYDTIMLKLAISADTVDNDLRASVIETLIGPAGGDVQFSDDELQMSLKEAKRQYKGDLLRKWKAAKKAL